VARSYLYVPGDQPEKFDKAVESGADALILDLEDGVAPDHKDVARGLVGEFLRSERAEGAAVQLWVRVNWGTALEVDLRTVVCPPLTGVWVPKAEPDTIRVADELLLAAERDASMRPGGVRVVALVETAAGVLGAAETAEAPRVIRMGIGEADLAAELGLQPGPGREELAPIRSQVVVASAAAGILPPVGSVSTDVRDLDALVSSTRTLLGQGFRARSAIHPRQVPVINEVFTPSADEVQRAREVVQRLAEAERRGSGVATDADGRLIDLAVARSAHEVLRRAGESTA
jgi:citrate lyase subunit beta / citryl-CoA lyase